MFSWRLQQIFLNTTWHLREKVNFRTCYSLPCNSWDVELHEKFSKFIYYVCLIFVVVFFLTLRNPPGGMINWQLQDLMIYNNLETDCSQSLCHFSFFFGMNRKCFQGSSCQGWPWNWSQWTLFTERGTHVNFIMNHRL